MELVIEPLFVACNQMCLLSNQIAGFFDQQYHWKEPIDISDFLHGHYHQGKVARKTTNLIKVLSGVHLVQSDSMILWSLVSLEGVKW